LDFGASRDYSEEFVEKYVWILKGAADNNRELVLDYSQQIGFLTGYESKVRISLKLYMCQYLNVYKYDYEYLLLVYDL